MDSDEEYDEDEGEVPQSECGVSTQNFTLAHATHEYERAEILVDDCVVH